MPSVVVECIVGVRRAGRCGWRLRVASGLASAARLMLSLMTSQSMSDRRSRMSSC